MGKYLFGGMVACIVALTAMCSAKDDAFDPNDLLTSAGQNQWTIENLGPQITLSTVMSTGVHPGDANTSTVVYFSLMGEPGKLVAVDFETGKTIKTIEVPDSQGSYGMRLASDGYLYLASHSSGNLYRYKPGSDTVENLGKPAEHVSFIWDVVEGSKGKIYGACYQQASIMEYDMATGKMRDLGPAKEGEDYARSLAWDDSTQRLYLGIGSHADVIEYNPATGEKRSLLPEEYKKSPFVSSIGATKGKVIARVEPDSKAIIIEAKTGEKIYEMPSFTGSLVSPPAADGTVYFSGSGKLCYYNPNTNEGKDTGYELGGEARGFSWTKPEAGEEPALLIATTAKNAHIYYPGKATGERRNCDVKPLPLHIQNIIAGPDGKIYSSGYVSGNLGILNPDTREHKQLGGVKQAEGMTLYGSKLFLGTYPGAIISVFDTAQDPQAGNPKALFSLKEQGQDRPFGMLGVPEENRVFIGTVPGYGLLEGALAAYDPDTTITGIYKNLIKDQSVVTLAYKNGILYGGTTIDGGLGIKPTAEEARLFLWDVKQEKLITDMVPVKEKRCISGLQFGPDGNLWGWADGTLFLFNPEKREVIYSAEKLSTDNPPRHHWRGGSMIGPVDGKFYGVHLNQLYELDTKTKEVVVLAEGRLEIITRDQKGRLYVILKDNLLQLSPR